MNIFVVNNGKETGPLTADEVKELISSSNLKPDDPAVLEGAAEWSTVADVLRQSVGPGVAVSAEGGGAMSRTLAGVEMGLAHAGIPYQRGGVAAAMESLTTECAADA